MSSTLPAASKPRRNHIPSARVTDKNNTEGLSHDQQKALATKPVRSNEPVVIQDFEYQSQDICWLEGVKSS
ncbi:hypothetical protein R3P38DRAFT_3229513 [Favolaschia claudopus]|uniref:Uncharacterized protein n=1 Tax=Favolaschia claudopus TaxID=2862362 RepID=A0AAV9ZNV9_9AGAR